MSLKTRLIKHLRQLIGQLRRKVKTFLVWLHYVFSFYVPQKILLLLIYSYRTIGTTHLGGSCRFMPSCSEYALQVLNSGVGPWKSSRLICQRLCKCHPFGPFGWDPVTVVKENSICGRK